MFWFLFLLTLTAQTQPGEPSVNCRQHCAQWGESPKVIKGQCFCLSDVSCKEAQIKTKDVFGRPDACGKETKNKKCLCVAYPPPGAKWICSNSCPDGFNGPSCGWNHACIQWSPKELEIHKKINAAIKQRNEENQETAKKEYCKKDTTYWGCRS